MKTIFLCVLTCNMMLFGYTQSNIDSVLREVNKNNLAIRSNASYWAAQNQQFKTGLTPYDPQVEYDYLFGSPAGAGNQNDFSVTQRLDFPSVYGRKKGLSQQQQIQAAYQQQAFRQEILLQAKLISLELIFLNRKKTILTGRSSNTSQLVLDYEKKLAQGDAIILDVNKAKLQLVNISNEQAINNNEIQKMHTRLLALNGGVPVFINDTAYAAELAVPDFETFDSIIEANDPLIKVYEQDKIISRQQLAVQKALNLPKLEAGYHSQGILGQNYRGVHAGITIPLWENKNRLKAAKLSIGHANENSSMHRLEHKMENKELYDELAVRQKAMNDYRSLFNSLNNQYLLNKALQLGQITVIQYFQEESYYFSAMDKLLQLELEYQKALAQLYKFKL